MRKPLIQAKTIVRELVQVCVQVLVRGVARLNAGEDAKVIVPVLARDNVRLHVDNTVQAIVAQFVEVIAAPVVKVVVWLLVKTIVSLIAKVVVAVHVEAVAPRTVWDHVNEDVLIIVHMEMHSSNFYAI